MRNTQGFPPDPPKTPSYGTELALGVKKGLLRYATHFLRHSVLKTGFYGTEGIFGTGNTLLRYGMKRPDAAIVWLALIRGCGHCVDSSDLRICHCVAGSGLRMRLP